MVPGRYTEQVFDDKQQASAVTLEEVTSHTDSAQRYVCTGCGNRTRFDVVETIRRRRYHHYTLGGDMTVDEDTTLEREIESVTCRWCERSDNVEELAQP